MTSGENDAELRERRPTPAEVSASLDRLRRAGRTLRARPAGETLDALCRVLDGWSDPESPWRQQLLRSLPDAAGFSRENVREGLSRALARWDGDALRALVAAERAGHETGFACTAVLLAGSIPMPTLLSMLAPLTLGSPVLAKCAARDPLTAHLVARSITETDALLGECIEVISFPGNDARAMQALLEAECIVAAGSDQTMAAVAARARPRSRLVCYGHRVSLAVLGDAATRGEALERATRALALDTALWDQQGCLSPIAVHVASPDPEAADRVAASLAAALEDAEKRWPRGRVDPDAAALAHHERAEAELRAAAGRRVTLRTGSAWTVIREEDAALRPLPLHRFLRVHPSPDADALLRALAPLAPHLAAVAVEGFERAGEGVVRGLTGLGASRVCAPGTLQAPPLDWRRDGHGVLTPLVA